MKKAVVTVTIGEKYEALAKVTHPTLKAYADRIGADFIVVDEIPKDMAEQGFTPYFAKLTLPRYFKEYDRICFIDSDCIVRPDCPDLFEVVPAHKVGIFKEGEFIPRRFQDLEMAARTYKTRIRLSPEKWKGQYYNSGVMVASKIHKTLFKPLDLTQIDEQHGWDYGEQGWINLQIINSKTPVHCLDYKFNRMTVMDEKTGEDRHASYIIHYAGAPDEISLEKKTITLPEFIQRDIDNWKENAPNYTYGRHLLVYIGGGMGDQVDAEPVLRHIKHKAYPEADIRVITDWPCLFRHLADKNTHIARREDMKLSHDTPYYKMETLPSPDTPLWTHVSHTLVHSTDFSTMSCLHKTLTSEEKQIHLPHFQEAKQSLDEKLGEGWENSVLIHAGRGWASKTFPVEWWDEIINGLDMSTILIGKRVSKEQGVVEVTAQATHDLRDKTTVEEFVALIEGAKVCVSNDSAPVHIAGAFNNHLVFIPSCKHPEHVLPFRRGSQDYKNHVMYKKLTCDSINSNPTQVHGQTIDWVEGDILDYLPEPQDVIKKISEIFRSCTEKVLV